jgi:hypothetical protein
MVCRSCGVEVDPEHRFCPWCAAPQQRKAVAVFPPHPEVEANGRGLRVARYFDPQDGPPHTRLSIYDSDGRVTDVVALDDESTAGLAAFLHNLGGAAARPRSVMDTVVDRLLGRSH